MSYSDKEIAIFNGLIELIKDGGNPYTITVSDIAKSANIGKGTLYDYFSSKEEAICRALIYFIDIEIEVICERMKSRDNFKDRFYELLLMISHGIENNISTVNVLLSAGEVKGFYEHMVNEKCSVNKFMELVNNVMENLLTTGYDEGIIGSKEDKFYQIMAIRGSICGFSHYLSKRHLYQDTSIDKAMETAYKLLLKTLN